MKVNGGNANRLQFVLRLNEECSGQTIHKDKSSVMFGKNTILETHGMNSYH
jgi:hypothetical protein